MIHYQSFQYIFPPRPKNPIPPGNIQMWDNGMMIAQPKINGSNCTIYLNGKDMYVYNRHGSRLTGFDIAKDEIMKLYCGNGWMVINGEFTNKAKLDSNFKDFRNKFCIFDLLVYDGQYMVGSTFEQRVKMLDNLLGTPTDYISPITENIYHIKSFHKDFVKLFDELIKIDMVEGLVLKRKSARLEIGTSENNNSKSQIKVRKPTKNYKF